MRVKKCICRYIWIVYLILRMAHFICLFYLVSFLFNWIDGFHVSFLRNPISIE